MTDAIAAAANLIHAAAYSGVAPHPPAGAAVPLQVAQVRSWPWRELWVQ